MGRATWCDGEALGGVGEALGGVGDGEVEEWNEM